MEFMIAFGIASIMLGIAMIIRTKVRFIRNMLVPASVIAGVIGLIVMNTGLITSTSLDIFVQIVNHLFVIVFISIGLTSSSKHKSSSNSTGKNIAKGSLGMGFLWNLLYALTPAVGAIIILLVGGFFGMDPLYGLLIPFAFTQGPGQASTFGTIFEQQYGIADAATVGITFAAIGFLICFLVGVPLAKLGVKRGLAKELGKNKVEGFIERGFYAKNEEKPELGKETMFSGNMDTMTFHFAIIGICYVLAIGMSQIFALIPGIGATISSMLFIYGMLAAYLVKFIMKKLKIDYMLDNTFQSKITGWATDFLVVGSFMAVKFSIIQQWLVPIITVSLVITLITVIVSLYFGKRLGGENDFERTLGFFGTATGTVPSGMALVRIVDPSLRTTTAIELGMMNVPMMASYVTLMTIFAMAAGTLSFVSGILLLLAPIPVYLIILKVFRVWGKKTYDFKDNTGLEEQTKKKEFVAV
ncbi:sodium/glutamate symporter [Paucisalibacillus sp. EB02]|uniref:sodium/glutamate symporter n=1 Tax=Paucisalibacillus sp. EB02 TaxID=1347087 RepID=UPI0004B8A051|nr:sodium/glutamate symporter [Paucisalibacillus sp. EB02]